MSSCLFRAANLSVLTCTFTVLFLAPPVLDATFRGASEFAYVCIPKGAMTIDGDSIKIDMKSFAIEPENAGDMVATQVATREEIDV